jgi:hypothetical protein
MQKSSKASWLLLDRRRALLGMGSRLLFDRRRGGGIFCKTCCKMKLFDQLCKPNKYCTIGCLNALLQSVENGIGEKLSFEEFIQLSYRERRINRS